MPTALERFWSKVNKTRTCWIWTGSSSPSSGQNSKWPYGSFFREGRIEKAHRFSYSEFVGSIPKGKLVLHSCDNTLCVRPDHLFVGTQKINMQDCRRKGRLVNPKNFGVGDTHWMKDEGKKKAWQAKRWTPKHRKEQAELMRQMRSAS